MSKKLIVFGLGFCAVVIVAISSIKVSDNNPQPGPASEAGQAVKSQDEQVIGGSIDQAVSLGANEKNKVVESKPIKASFQFNAIAPHWKETNASEDNRKLELRASNDAKDWGPWLEIEASGPLRDDDPHPDRIYAETPLLIGGQYFQYKITLSRDSVSTPSPTIYDLKVNHIDSRSPEKTVGLADKIKSLFKSDKAYAAPQQHPRVISRSQWGSPDPYGNLYKGTERYWPPSHKPVKQVFIHHTVSANNQADFAAGVRAIWDFHANTRGWGDIGYNYLVDYQGNIYQGRLGGDNAVGGHVLDYNRGSVGVALLGCFDGSATCQQLNGGTVGPSTQMVNNLTSLLSNKTSSFEIDPWGSNTICDVNNQNCLNLPTITGHRDAGQTSCPGNLTVDMLQSIRNGTREKNMQGWTYSAKQLDFGAVDLSTTSSKNVTLEFKNTGQTTWSNTSNKTSLYNMEPPGRSSIFQGSGWLSPTKPAMLNEASVAPGGTGSFTFNVKRPNLPPGRYQEAHTLITDNGNTPGAFFSLPIELNCTIGQASNPRPNGTIIKDVNSGRVYLIEDGKKRYIVSSLAAVTNGLNLSYAAAVSGAETASLANGPQIHTKEGTLLKSKESASIYILDETPSGFVRRWVPTTTVMNAFGMKFNQVHIIRQATLSAYAAGPTLQSSSLTPDGRLVKGSDGKVHLVQNGTRRYITSPVVFNSYGFSAGYIGAVSDARISQLAASSSLNTVRSGTLLKTASSPTIYLIDTDGPSPLRRKVTTPYALTAAGYRFESVVTTSSAQLNGYNDTDALECYK